MRSTKINGRGEKIKSGLRLGLAVQGVDIQEGENSLHKKRGVIPTNKCVVILKKGSKHSMTHEKGNLFL